VYRFDAQTGADREVQRILLELLNQMDGFDQTTNVKVCTVFRALLMRAELHIFLYPSAICGITVFTTPNFSSVISCFTLFFGTGNLSSF
jgi:hypothetical protein